MNNVKVNNFQTNIYEVTLAMSATTLSSGDVMSTTVEIPLVSALQGNPTIGTAAGAGLAPLRGRLVSLRVLDEDDQGAPLDVVFMRSNVSLGTVDSAVSISDADAREIVGIVKAISFTDLINSQQSEPEFLPKPFVLGAGVTSLYVSAITRGAPTTTASGIRLQVGIELENQVLF